MKVKTDEIKFVKDLYPRNGLNPEVINQYVLNLDALPPIVVTKNRILVDGYHRLVAHKNARKEEIKAEIIDVPEGKILLEAARRNALHGRQLTISEKRYLSLIFYKQKITQDKIGRTLAIDQSTVSKWLKDEIAETTKARNERILELHLAGHTHGEIGKLLDLSKGQISKLLQNMMNHIIEKPPTIDNPWLYTYRMIPKKGERINYQGGIPVPLEVIENVVWRWSKPFDLVVDPMAGSGVVVDICKRLFRRYRAYDIRPLREDVKPHDITEGYPRECKDCDLIFLDPPYFKKVDYGDGSASSMDRGQFLDFMLKVARDTHKTVRKEGYVALVFGDYLDYSNETAGVLGPDIYSIFKHAGFASTCRIQLPLSIEQYSPSDVERTKKQEILLSIARDLYIFKKGVS